MGIHAVQYSYYLLSLALQVHRRHALFSIRASICRHDEISTFLVQLLRELCAITTEAPCVTTAKLIELSNWGYCYRGNCLAARVRPLVPSSSTATRLQYHRLMHQLVGGQAPTL